MTEILGVWIWQIFYHVKDICSKQEVKNLDQGSIHITLQIEIDNELSFQYSIYIFSIWYGSYTAVKVIKQLNDFMKYA